MLYVNYISIKMEKKKPLRLEGGVGISESMHLRILNPQFPEPSGAAEVGLSALLEERGNPYLKWVKSHLDLTGEVWGL